MISQRSCDGGFHGVGDGFERPLEVGDGHADLVDVVIAEGGGQLGAGDGGLGGQLDGRGVVLEVADVVE